MTPAWKSSGCARWSALPARRRRAGRRSAGRPRRPRTRAAPATRARSAPDPPARRLRRTPPSRPTQYGVRARRSPPARPRKRARRGSAEQPVPARERRRREYGEPNRSGGPSGRTCHHDWPAGGQPVDEARTPRGPSRPPGSEVGCSRMPLERGSFTLRSSPSEGLRASHAPPESAGASEADPDPARRARVDARPLRGQGDRRRPVEVARDDLPRRPRDARRRRPLRAGKRERRWHESPMPRSATTAGWATRGGRRGQVGVPGSRRGSTASRRTGRAPAQGRGRPGRPLRGARRGGCPARRGALTRRGGARGLDRGRPLRGRPCTLEPVGSTSTASVARFGAWYELFPRSFGGFAGVERGAARARRARLRRRLPAAGPPDRHDEPQGPQQHARRRPGRPGQPVGDRQRGGRPRRASTPSSARSTTSSAWSRAAGALGLEIALDFAIQCSPDHPWLRSTPSGSTGAPTAR